MKSKTIQVTNDNYQFAGNKEYKVKGFVHIEDWFDGFLEQNDNYWKETYYELLRFESAFYYLKEFVVQAKLLGVKEVVSMLKQKVSTQRIIDAIPEMIPNTLSPFETLLTKWIVVDYVFAKKETFKVDALTLYNTIKTITERDTKNFPIQIDINKNNWDLDSSYVSGNWRLVEVKHDTRKAPIESETTPTQTASKAHLKLSKRTGAKTDLIRVLNALYELKFFVNSKETEPLKKKEFMQQVGQFFGTDLSNYDAALSQALREQPLETNLKIFDEMKAFTENQHYSSKEKRTKNK